MARTRSTSKLKGATKVQRVSIPAQNTEARFQAESDVRTLQNAAEIKTNPRRMKVAKALAADQAKKLKSITK